jgi:hypothetical protein
VKKMTVALIGPHGNADKELVGNYLGEICPGNKFDCIVTPAAAIKAKLDPMGGTLVVSSGCGEWARSEPISVNVHTFTDLIFSLV